MKSGEIHAKDGTKLHYKVWPGNASAPAGRKPRIALLHSLAMDHTFWIPVVEKLNGAADVLAVDCRGHGLSDKPAGPYTVELFAEDLAAVMDDADWPKALIAGCSMGGCVALAFADAYPERVEALGLIDTTAYYGDDAPKAWEERAQKAAQGGMEKLIGFQKSRWFGDAFREANPEVVEAAINVFLANDIPAYGETCRMLGACDMRAAMAKFGFPTRVIVGEEDYAAPVAMAEAMRDAIPGASLLVIDKARHLTPLEVPELIARELKRLSEKA
jgi:3-oxoadipate enol-lactonase